MVDVTAAEISAHRANIRRYRRLLRTQLEPHERQYVLRRLAQEQTALAGARFPASAAADPGRSATAHLFRNPIPKRNWEMIMSKGHQLRSNELEAGVDLDELLHPASAFDHPMDVVRDPDLTLNERRAILSSWASDACAVESMPALRRTPQGRIVTFDDVVDALRSLDGEAVNARWNPRRRLARTLRSRSVRGAPGSDSSPTLQ